MLRRLAVEPLHVAPEFVGRALASPARRFIAFGIDWFLLIIPTIIVSVAAALALLWVTDRPAFHALSTLAQARDTPQWHDHLRDMAPLLVRIEAPGLPESVKEAVHAHELDKAADIMATLNFNITLQMPEAEVEELPQGTVRIRVDRIIPPIARGIAIFCVPALYFTLFSCSRRGATIGKRIAGIRVIRLDGEKLSLLEGLERFVGYVHLPATLCLSLLDLWRDPNRRLPHDRTVHTAVVYTREPKVKAEPVAA